MLQTAIEVNGHECHWIESKGAFGDIDTMHENWTGQFHTYTQHFGDGLVIYWLVCSAVRVCGAVRVGDAVRVCDAVSVCAALW